MSKKVFLKGTLILACTGLVSRIAGFFYRIFLSHAIGAEGLGLYQLILPLQGLMAALSYTGIQSALSRLIASRLALQEKKEALNTVPLIKNLCAMMELLVLQKKYVISS